MTNQKKHKAILINAKENTASIVEVGHYTDIYKHCGFSTFTTVQLNGRGETLYVDDEGLINETSFGFEYEDYGNPLMGNGLILGCDLNTGDSKDTEMTLEEVRKKVQTFKRPDGFPMFVRNSHDLRIV